MASNRGTLRALTVGAGKKRRSRTVEWAGEKYEVRAPSLRMEAEIKDAAGLKPGDPKSVTFRAALKLRALTVIRCTYEPGTTVLVFEEADLDGFEQQGDGGFVDALYTAAVELQAADEAEGKESGKTPSSPGPSGLPSGEFTTVTLTGS